MSRHRRRSGWKIAEAVAACALLAPALSSTTHAAVISPKRGFADTGAGYSNLQAVGADWYYTWGTGPASPGSFDAKFYPMFWSGPSQTTINDVKNTNPDYVLGFNEPERSDQANMTVAQAISSWTTISNSFTGTNTKLVSPAVADTGGATGGQQWLANFMSQATANNLKIDAVAFHWYGVSTPTNPSGAASSFLSRVDSYHNSYGKPVFITEFAIHDWGGAYTDAEIIEANRQFLDIVIPGLESRSYVAGYSWYHWFSDAHLYDGSPPTPTAMGRRYVGALFTGQVDDVGGDSLGEHVAYLNGGELTMTGSAGTVRYINALANSSTISGTIDWGLTQSSNWVRVQPGATLRKAGSNQITFSALSLTNNGTIMVDGGTLLLDNITSVAGTGIFRIDSGTLALNTRGASIGQALEMRGGTLSAVTGTQTVAGPVTLYNTASTFSPNLAGNLLVSGTISGAGRITFEGAGTTTISNSNTYTGDTYIDNGTQGPATVRVTQSNPFGTGNVYFNPAGNGTTGKIEITSNRIVPNNIGLTGRNNSTPAIVNISGSNTFSGTVTLNVGGGQYIMQSDAGLLTFSGGAGGVAFTSGATGPRTLTLQGAGAGVVSGLIQNGTATMNVSKQGSGVWTLSGNNTYTGDTTVSAGILRSSQSFRNSASLSVADGATFAMLANGNTLQVGALTLNPTGTLDLSNNDLVVNSAAFTTIQNLVLVGFGNTSGGITSSTSDGSQILALFDNALVGASDWNGVAIPDNAIVGKYTYFGDANIDGQVTGDDYTVIDANLNTTPSVGLGWLSGDMNLDGDITGDDYTVIDANLGLGVGSPLAPSRLSAVPEPSSIALIAAAGVVTIRRRRPR